MLQCCTRFVSCVSVGCDYSACVTTSRTCQRIGNLRKCSNAKLQICSQSCSMVFCQQAHIAHEIKSTWAEYIVSTSIYMDLWVAGGWHWCEVQKRHEWRHNKHGQHERSQPTPLPSTPTGLDVDNSSLTYMIASMVTVTKLSDSLQWKYSVCLW